MRPHILSNDSSSFSDRHSAGLLLGEELKKRVSGCPVVLGVPRGGVVTAAAVALVLNCEFDIVLTHKIPAPFNPELAIGAISESGKVFLDSGRVKATEASSSYIEKEKKVVMEELERRSKIMRLIYPKVSLQNRVVIVTDDGIATGATIEAALWMARKEKPKTLIAAFPVAPLDILKKLNAAADEWICLKAPDSFVAVGEFYDSFLQVSDQEVLEILKQQLVRKQRMTSGCD